LGDDHAPRFYDGARHLRSGGIPADDNGKAGSLAAIGAGSDVWARDEGGTRTVA
jgi:hypothetical protein